MPGHPTLAKAADALSIPGLVLTLPLAQIYEEVGGVPMETGLAAAE